MVRDTNKQPQVFDNKWDYQSDGQKMQKTFFQHEEALFSKKIFRQTKKKIDIPAKCDRLCSSDIQSERRTDSP